MLFYFCLFAKRSVQGGQLWKEISLACHKWPACPSETERGRRRGRAKDLAQKRMPRVFFAIKWEKKQKKNSVGVLICVSQSTTHRAQGARQKRVGGGRGHATDWILEAGYVTSLGMLVKHSKQRGKCLKGPLCCWRAWPQHRQHSPRLCHFPFAPQKKYCEQEFMMNVIITVLNDCAF